MAQPQPAEAAPLQASELSVQIALSSFFDHFSCSICLGELSRCALLRPCGHQYCEGCIREALDRQGKCPLCQASATLADIVPNPAADRLIERLKDEAQKQSVRMMSKLWPAFPPDSLPSASSSGSPSLNRAESASALSAALSPVEHLFRKHIVPRALRPFEEAWKEIEEEERVAAAAAASSSSALASAAASVAPAAAAAASAASSSSFPMSDDGDEEVASPGGTAAPAAPALAASVSSRSKALLLQQYESFLTTLAPSAFLDPVYLTVKLISSSPPSSGAGGGAVSVRVACRSWDGLDAVARKIVAQSRSPDSDPAHALKSLWLGEGGASVHVTAVKLPGALPLALNSSAVDYARVLSDWGLHGEVELTIKGRGIEFERVAAVQCFMQVFDARLEQRVDYFKCQECALNWICQSCSISCHAGHTLQPFMLAHKPTYAACYCQKKTKNCTLVRKK